MRGWARAEVWEDRQASLEKLWTMAFRGLWRKMDLNIIKSWLYSLSPHGMLHGVWWETQRPGYALAALALFWI